MCHTHTRLVTCDTGPYYPSSSNFLGPLCVGYLSLTGGVDGHRGRLLPLRTFPVGGTGAVGRIWNAGEPWGPIWRLVTTPGRFPFQARFMQQLPAEAGWALPLTSSLSMSTHVGAPTGSPSTFRPPGDACLLYQWSP